MIDHAYNLANQGYDFKKKLFTEDELYEIMDHGNFSKLDTYEFLMYQTVPSDLIIKYYDRFKPYLKSYSEHNKLSEELIRYICDQGDMEYDIMKYQEMTDDLFVYIIDHNIETLDHINEFIKLRDVPSEILLRYLNYLDYRILFKYQKIDEDLCVTIFNFTGDDTKMHQMFSVGAVYQWWSKGFIERFKMYIDWYAYNVYPERVRIPYEKMTYFIEDDPNGYHPDEIEWPILSDDTDPKFLQVNNKDVPPEYWKRLITAHYHSYGLFLDCFYGFMVVYRDGYDLQNFGMKYEDGGVYERHTDMTNTYESFGNVIRTFPECRALLYDTTSIREDYKKIIIVKVMYEDVVYAGRTYGKTDEGFKIRAKKVQVLGNYNGNIANWNGF